MALPLSALWEGRPLTEKRLYVSYAKVRPSMGSVGDAYDCDV